MIQGWFYDRLLDDTVWTTEFWPTSFLDDRPGWPTDPIGRQTFWPTSFFDRLDDKLFDDRYSSTTVFLRQIKPKIGQFV